MKFIIVGKAAMSTNCLNYIFFIKHNHNHRDSQKEQLVSLIYNFGKIGKDQVTDYAKRKGLSFEETERWLAPVLN